MKLSQLGLTPAGIAATQKLDKQVHKATVAAAFEPTLRLGVLGIEIGQEQSTGDTSRPAVPMGKAKTKPAIKEEADAEAEIPRSDAWPLISKLARELNIKLDFKGADFDRGEAADDAVKIMKIWTQDVSKSNNIIDALLTIRRYLQGTPAMEELKNTAAALPHFGFKPSAWFQGGLDANATLVQKSKGMQDHITAVEILADFLVTALQINPDDKHWGKSYPFVNAVVKKLGLR